MHGQSVQRSEQPLRFGHQALMAIVGPCFPGRAEFHDQPAHEGGHGPVAAVSLGGKERPDPGCVLERHPDARVHGPLLVQREELAQQG